MITPLLRRRLTFPAGSTNGTTRSVDLSIINDTRVEGDETVAFSLDNLVDGTGGQVTLADWGGASAFTRMANVNGTARDAYGDGVFEQLTTTEPTVTTAKLQPPRDQDRSLFEFNVSTIPDNATVLSAALKLTASYRTGGYPAAVVDLLGYAGDGQLTTADASVSTTVVGNASITSLTTYSIPLDAAFVQSLLGTATHVGIATRLISGAGVSFHSTEAAPNVRVAHLEIQYTSSGHSVTISDDDTAEVSFANVASSVGESAGSHALDVQLTITGNGTHGTGRSSARSRSTSRPNGRHDLASSRLLVRQSEDGQLRGRFHQRRSDGLVRCS